MLHGGDDIYAVLGACEGDVEETSLRTSMVMRPCLKAWLGLLWPILNESSRNGTTLMKKCGENDARTEKNLYLPKS